MEKGEVRKRLILPAIVLAGILVLVEAWHLGATAAVETFLRLYLIEYNLPPFGDAHGITSAIACERMGLETYRANPCHYRPDAFVYPPSWKLLSILPMTTGWTVPLAILLIGCLLLGLYGLPLAQSRRGWILMVLAVLSPASAMALNYGNNDMLIFALVVGGTALLAKARAARAGGYGLFVAAGLLKYFPFAALAWALREPPRGLITLVGAAALVILAFVLIAGEQLPLSLANIYRMSPVSYVFGVKNVGLILEQLSLASRAAIPAISLGLAAAVVALAWRQSASLYRERIDLRIGAAHWRFLVVGALLVSGAYFATQNVVYRTIFLLMVLPGLDALRRADVPRYGLVSMVAVLVMYSFPLRIYSRMLAEEGSRSFLELTLLGMMVRELCWLYLVTMLMALVLCEVRAAPIWRNLPMRKLNYKAPA